MADVEEAEMIKVPMYSTRNCWPLRVATIATSSNNGLAVQVQAPLPSVRRPVGHTQRWQMGETTLTTLTSPGGLAPWSPSTNLDEPLSAHPPC